MKIIRGKNRIRVYAPAKVNLFLEVLGKREDGYHEIETVMQPIGLYDVVEISEQRRLINSIEVLSDHPGLPRGVSNLAFRAAWLIRSRYQVKKSLRIFIRKRIPIGAGLGGGSSDAAAVLIGLKHLWKLGLSRLELALLGREIGSDVPFFIYGQTALCKGRGEIVFPLPVSLPFYYVILWPGIAISTRKVYQNLNKDLTNRSRDVNIFVNILQQGNLGRVKGALFNRLAATVLKLYPELMEPYRVLKRIGPTGVSISGSGSSIFRLCKSSREAVDSEKEVRKLARQVGNQQGTVLNVQGLTR